jgi:hypothetical protein
MTIFTFHHTILYNLAQIINRTQVTCFSNTITLPKRRDKQKSIHGFRT